MRTESRLEQVAGITAVAFLVIGCFVVLRPFISALMWAAILCYCTWPLYLRLEKVLRGRRTPAALLMILLISVVLILPFALVGMNLAENLANTVQMVRDLLDKGLPQPPAWLQAVPLFGDPISQYWRELGANPDNTTHMVRDFIVNARGWLLQRGMDLGQGILQLGLSVLVTFFFYRDGEVVVNRVADGFKRIAGDQTQYLLGVVGSTIRGVVYGLLGTALAQGILAGIGMRIAGVPNSLLLGLLTFFLALLPFGAPLVWVPATLWLFHEHHVGMGVFMGVWGLLAISGIDNVLRPYLISRETNLPFVPVLLGVIGGVLAFGFIGVFIGPVLLAVSFALLHEWAGKKAPAAATAPAPAAADDSAAAPVPSEDQPPL